MGVQTTTLKEGATGITIVGGSDLAFTPDGVSVPNGVHLAAAAVADFRVRPTITLKTRNPQLNNGTFSKAKRWLSFTLPTILTDLSVVYNVVRIEVEVHPELTAAAAVDIARIGAQLLSDDDLVTFIASGSLA